jgi:hypothetical protein
VRTLLFALITLIASSFSLHAPRSSLHAPRSTQIDATVSRNEATVNFPDTVTFRLELESPAELASAVLAYDVEQFSCVEVNAQVPVEVDGATAEWTWVMSRSGNPPPGSRLWWEWTVTDAAGNTFTTPRQELTFADERFTWRTVEAEGVHLHWYRGDEVGPLLLDAAVEGLDRLENDMGIELQDDVQLFIYGDSEDMREAVLYIQNWAGGVAFSEYNTILMGVPPDIADDWGRSTVRHELAHLVVGQFGRSCVGGNRPTWLEEGLAVYAEGEPQAHILADIEAATRNNTFAPVRSLNGAFPAHGEEAGIAYSQSYSLVAYLFETYGEKQMQELILALAEGAGYDEALEQVYGFNADGLETEWRAAIGVPPRQIPPTPTPLTAAAVPTFPPLDPAESVPTPPSAAATAAPAEAEPAGSGNGPCALGLLPLFFLALVGTRPKRFQVNSWMKRYVLRKDSAE